MDELLKEVKSNIFIKLHLLALGKIDRAYLCSNLEVEGYGKNKEQDRVLKVNI